MTRDELRLNDYLFHARKEAEKSPDYDSDTWDELIPLSWHLIRGAKQTWEYWELVDKDGEVCQGGFSPSYDVKLNKLPGDKGEVWKKKFEFEAWSYNEAMTRHHELMEFEPYEPFGEHE